jgi:hypothetical protein
VCLLGFYAVFLIKNFPDRRDFKTTDLILAGLPDLNSLLTRLMTQRLQNTIENDLRESLRVDAA